MNGRSHRLWWAPPLLVGVSAAAVAEVAVGMLLYAGPGLTRSVTTVLAVEGFSFAAGLGTAPGPGSQLTERLRRRWLLCLVAFLIAAVFSTSWSVIEALGATRLGQGVGLAALAALPLYACGNVLGGIASATRSDPDPRAPGPGAPAAVGAGLGFLMTGLLLPRAPMPSSVLLGCLILLSLSGLLYGIVLASRPYVEVLLERTSPTGTVRVEAQRWVSRGLDRRCLLEGGHLRACRSLGEPSPTGWDVELMSRTPLPEEDPFRALLVGGGTSDLPRFLVRHHPTATIDVLEHNAVVVDVAREQFGTQLEVGVGGRVTVAVGVLGDLLEALSGPYDLVFVDRCALRPVGGEAGLSRAVKVRLEDLAGPDATVVWGPSEGEAEGVTAEARSGV